MQAFDLDTILLRGETPNSDWTVREAVEGVQVFGGIGSGKTSGSGRTLALKYLSHGFGGLVLTVKPDEKDLWVDYCSITDRTDDLVIVEPNGKYSFDFLSYEANQGSREGITANILQVLKTVINASEEKSSGKRDDKFWDTALDMLIFNVIDLCIISGLDVTVEWIYKVAQSLPKDNATVERLFENKESEESQRNPFLLTYSQAQKAVLSKINAWKKQQPLELLNNKQLYKSEMYEAVKEARTMDLLTDFFLTTYLDLNDKTRSIVDFSFSGFLFRLLNEPVYSLFCSTKNRKGTSPLLPEDSLDGKIILINLPVKLYNKAGRDIQIMFKYIWQRAMERRNVKANGRPVFLWADEAQNFLHEYDAEYQATARSSRIATVYLSQNLPNYHANMGGEKSEFRVKSFLGTLATKIFHANADYETNKYASELIGEAYRDEVTKGSSISESNSISQSVVARLEKMVRPEEFVGLKTGSKRNNFLVECYMHKQGNPFSDGMNHKGFQFDQLYIP